MDTQLLLASLIKNSFWMKLVGVVLIITGVIYCISIFGILIGWLPIWLGVLLFSSAKRLDVLREGESPAIAVESIEKLSLFFKISGIVTLVYLVLLVFLLPFFLFGAVEAVTGFDGF